MNKIYDQNKIQIWHSDILEIADKIDYNLVLTDPPYNVGLNYSNGDNLSIKDYTDWCASWFDVLRKKAQLIAFTPGTKMENQEMWFKIERPKWIGIHYKSNQCASTALGGFNAWEPIYFYGKRFKALRQDVWNFPIAKQKDVGNRHVCPKNLKFWSKLLEDISTKDCIVFDGFVGSGSTALAAKNLGIPCIGSDFELSYCELAKERLENLAS